MKVVIKEFETNYYYEGVYSYGKPQFYSDGRWAKVYKSMKEAKWIMHMIKKDCEHRICYEILDNNDDYYGQYCRN